MGIFLAVVIALIALILAPGELFYYDVTPKIVVLLVGTAFVLCSPPPRQRASRPFSLLVLCGIASLALSTVFSVNPSLSFWGSYWRRFGFLTQAGVLVFAWLLARHTGSRPDRVRAILRIVAGAGAILSLYGIAQYFGWDPILPAAAYHIGEGTWMIVRPPGTLGYASYFATWLVATVFLNLALAGMETGVGRYAAGICAALAAIAMVLTGTRAAMLGLAAGGAVWLLRRGFRVSRRMVAAAAVVLACGAAFYYSPPGWRLRSRARWFREDPWGGARLGLWRDSAIMALHRPILGYGPEVFTANFPRFESKQVASGYPDFFYESPHNMFLDVFVGQGIPGLAILAAFSWLGLRVLWRLKEPVAAWLAAGLAGIVVCQQFTVFSMPTALVFFVTVGLGMAMAEAPAGERTRGRTVETIVCLAAALAMAAAGLHLMYSDFWRQRAKQALLGGNLASASASYDRAGGGADLWYSRACLAAAQKTVNPVARLQAVTMAGAAAARATRTAEDPFNAWYNLAVLYGIENNAAGAESSLRSAIAARPNWFKPHWTLAQVLSVEGRRDEAHREAAIARDLDGGKHPEIFPPKL